MVSRGFGISVSRLSDLSVLKASITDTVLLLDFRRGFGWISDGIPVGLRDYFYPVFPVT
jgi:hypothetical protein